MSLPEKLHFKVSSALKNIIGKDLITDGFVAIFELVKNSFDANAKKVDLFFNDVNINLNNASIIIQDDGKGMDIEDVKNKWLFVAYSAKKEGIDDYRDEIKSKRIQAGAKGIGRFSCDRLGRKLTIYTRRNVEDKISKLTVDWDEFEKNMQETFERVSVDFEYVEECPYELNTGTVLEISKLRDTWEADKLVTLRRSLEKLINPAQGNDANAFKIHLHANDYISHDKAAIEAEKEFDAINGEIKNFLFEKLDLKATKIQVQITEDGKFIITELSDRGNFIYRLKEENPYFSESVRLSNINVFLFALNSSSKAMFTQYMGVRPVNFGSVFVYKNGFRVNPIGEIGRGDVFGLDGRKQQGTSRFFGTRDLIGRIEINGSNETFKEASSRDGGLERNEAFELLHNFFFDHVLKRLERFAIGVVKYGNIDNFDVSDLNAEFPKDKALEFISALTKSDGIIDISFNPNIFDVVSNASEKSLSTLLSNFSRIASKTNNPELVNEVKKIEDKLKDFSLAAKDAEEEAKKEKERRKHAEKVAKEEAEKARKAEEEARGQREKTEHVTKQSIFLRSMVTSDIENIVSLHHHIGIAAGTIENYVRSVSKKIRSGEAITADNFLKVLDEISFVARQISATTRFATKANFNLEAELVEQNICEYIEEYVMNICSGLVKINKDVHTNLNFEWESNVIEGFVIKFRPLEIAMILDSLINNAVKAGAKNMIFTADQVEKNSLVLKIANDGASIPEGIRSNIFDMGFTTTKGSGLGLHHVKNIVSGMKGEITLSKNSPIGMNVEFLIKFSR
ncbi:MAG: sensor histidine kinase [Methylotenera sp.]